MNKLQELQALIQKKNSNPALTEILNRVQMMKGEKGDTGEKGYTPQKGKDYYSETEINSIITYIQSKVKDGVQGEQGIQGLTGKDGNAPIRGVDYYTTKDQEKILKDILNKIPKSKDGVSPSINEIVNKAVDELKKNPVNFNDIQGTGDLKKLIEFLKMGGFRGGGNMQGVFTDKITLSLTAPVNPKYGDLWYNIT